MSRNKGSVKAKRERTDREKLELFIRKFNELQNTRLAKTGFRFEHRVQYTPETVKSDLKQPDEADLRDYLMTFRQFISENEDVFLNRIFNICHQRLTSDEIKQHLAQAREAFEREKQHNGILFQMDGRQFTPLQITDLYLNSMYFHNDLESQQQLDSMAPFVADFPRSYFLNFVINVTRVILYVGNVITHAFQEGLFQFEDGAQASPNTQE
jgi:hypothetical protein